ncbi:HRDC domain-containing protein [Methanoculleus chikugoensis]|uniref:HRDC domain-containing protein n=1 Tax=Methanoculleus chikugoensis TaxID=118126 RepID=UPI000A5FA4A8|nr:HRDC domain-containing protein [Methanoculleus chikugoensis]
MKDRDERPFDAELFEDLRVIRKRLADDLSIPPYAVFHDRTLKEMARRYPQSLEAFAAIPPGVGNAKLQKFGEIFIAAIGSRRSGRPGGEVPECPPAMAGEGRMLAAGGDAAATPGGEHPEPAVQSGTPRTIPPAPPPTRSPTTASSTRPMRCRATSGSSAKNSARPKNSTKHCWRERVGWVSGRTRPTP